MKFKIGVKLITAFGGILLFCFIITLGTIINFNKIKQSQVEISTIDYPSYKRLMEIESDVANARRVLLQHILVKDEKTSIQYESDLKNYMIRIDEHSKYYKNIDLRSEEETCFKSFEENWMLYKEYSNKALKESALNNDIKAQEIVNEGQKYYDESSKYINKGLQIHNVKVENEQISMDKIIENAKKEITLYLSILLICTMILASYTILGIIKMTNKLTYKNELDKFI